jgi:hypothetical protein
MSRPSRLVSSNVAGGVHETHSSTASPWSAAALAATEPDYALRLLGFLTQTGLTLEPELPEMQTPGWVEQLAARTAQATPMTARNATTSEKALDPGRYLIGAETGRADQVSRPAAVSA